MWRNIKILFIAKISNGHLSRMTPPLRTVNPLPRRAPAARLLFCWYPYFITRSGETVTA